MKQFLLTCLGMGLSVSLYGQSGSDEQTIRSLVQASFDSIWSGLKKERIQTYYTPDFILLENGVVWNTDSIRTYQTGLQNRLETMKKANQTFERKNRFEFVKVAVTGNTAWVAYQNYATFLLNNTVVDEAHWLESATLVKTPSGWKFQMLHSTPYPKAKNKK